MSGFRTEDLAEVFDMNEDTIRKLQGLQEDRRNIVRVKGRLQVARPPQSREERERLERQEREEEREQCESCRGGHGRDKREREERERENKSESKRRNNVRGDKADVDVDMTMALRRLYAP